MNDRSTSSDVAAVVLTRGDRPDDLDAALASIRRQRHACSIVVVRNGADAGDGASPAAADIVVDSEVNLGVPAGRDLGLRSTDADIVLFLDDDAELLDEGTVDAVVEVFDGRPDVAAVALRLVDEAGTTARRHVPRIGARRPEFGGPVATFLGGACAVRRSAYERAGGYWGELFYAHEELDLSWRLHDLGQTVWYLPDHPVHHPRTPIGRHEDGWRRTGRNRVMVARRNLPWALLVLHVALWLVLGTVRAPDSTCRRAYVRGWRDGWSVPVPRAPIRWSTVWRLSRAGRPPIV